MKANRLLVALGLAMMCSLSVGLGGCAAAPRAERPEPPTLREWDEFQPATRDGVWLGGQPSDAAIDRFVTDAGGAGGVVVNLRTDKEMAYLPYYDRSVAARGVRYVRIPTSGSTLDASVVEAYSDAVGTQSGPVMMHCASGGRATMLWAMVRMRNEGLSADEAIAWLGEYRGEPLSERGEGILRRYQAERDGEPMPTE